MKKANDIIYMYINNNVLDMDKIINDFSPYLYTIIENAGNFKPEDIEEIISDTYLILWNNMYKLDINKKLSSYLVGITKNLIRKHYKILYSPTTNLDDYEEKLILNENLELTIINKDTHDKIIEILNTLKLEDKEIFEEFYYNFRKVNEIALLFNISESKVKTKLHRISKKIRKELLKGGYSFDE